MLKLIYASTASTAMGPDALGSLLETSRERNAAADVTGMLLHAAGGFLQHLEGPDGAVDEIFRSIRGDTRHTAVRLLARDPVGERRFEGWWMGFEDLDHRLAGTSAFKAPTRYPLVDPALVTDPTVATTLLGLYARNP